MVVKNKEEENAAQTAVACKVLNIYSLSLYRRLQTLDLCTLYRFCLQNKMT